MLSPAMSCCCNCLDGRKMNGKEINLHNFKNKNKMVFVRETSNSIIIIACDMIKNHYFHCSPIISFGKRTIILISRQSGTELLVPLAVDVFWIKMQ
jgi:hypothetical protein